MTHTQHEYGSILHFMEQTFDLPSLGTNKVGPAPNDRGYTDVRGVSLVDSFDFTQKPPSRSDSRTVPDVRFRERKTVRHSTRRLLICSDAS